MIKDIFYVPEKILYQKAEEVTIFNDSIRSLVEDMIDTMRYHEGLGLAAQQIGVLKRVIVSECDKRLLIIVNPVIKHAGKGQTHLNETCFSEPEIMVPVKRAALITVTGQDYYGLPLSEMRLTNLEARIIQHEIDHLEGKLLSHYLEELEDEEQSE